MTAPFSHLDTPGPLTIGELPSLADKWLFVGIDLAPMDTLETGVATIDRQRNLVWMDKYDLDREIFHYLDSLGAKSRVIIALDLPKSLSFESKWRQQEVKMHPLRVENQRERFAPRAAEFYRRLTAKGYFVVNFLVPQAKMRYGMQIPFRSRSPLGCRALQAALRQTLKIKNVPTNLAPSSVLDATIGAYVAWSLYQSQRHWDKKRVKNLTRVLPDDVKLTLDTDRRLYCEPLRLIDIKLPRG